jgi:hypothetical protein
MEDPALKPVRMAEEGELVPAAMGLTLMTMNSENCFSITLEVSGPLLRGLKNKTRH